MGRARLTWSLTPHSPAEEVTGPVVAALGGRVPRTPVRTRFAPSPMSAADRHHVGQDLLLSRTMLSNHGLPYVGRFACDWHRLATTDPHTAHGQVYVEWRRVTGGDRPPWSGPAARPPRRCGTSRGWRAAPAHVRPPHDGGRSREHPLDEHDRRPFDPEGAVRWVITRGIGQVRRELERCPRRGDGLHATDTGVAEGGGGRGQARPAGDHVVDQQDPLPHRCTRLRLELRAPPALAPAAAPSGAARAGGAAAAGTAGASRRATARASSLAWSNPRRRRRAARGRHPRHDVDRRRVDQRRHRPSPATPPTPGRCGTSTAPPPPAPRPRSKHQRRAPLQPATAGNAGARPISAMHPAHGDGPGAAHGTPSRNQHRRAGYRRARTVTAPISLLCAPA